MSEVIPPTVAASTSETIVNTPPPAAAPPAPWMEGFNDNQRAFFNTKGFQKVTDLAESYINLEKLRGVPEDRLLKIAEKMRDDNGVLTDDARKIFERLGAPQESKDYQLEVPAENGDAKQAELFKELFFKEGIPKTSAERLVKQWNEYQGAAFKAQKEQAEQAFKSQSETLKNDWQGAFEQRVQEAKEGVKILGLDPAAVDAIGRSMGHDKAMKAFQKIGAGLGEGRFVQGKSPNAAMSREDARAHIENAKKDKGFVDKLNSGDTETQQRWNRWHEVGYAET